MVGIALGIEARLNAGEIARSEKLALLRRDSQMHGAGLAVPHPGGQRLGHLAGGADQVLEVAQRNGPAESTDGGRSILAGLLDRLRIGPSSSFRGIGDGLQADGQIQRSTQRTRRNSALQARALAIIRHHVAAAGRQARPRASITETDRHGPVIGNPGRVDSGPPGLCRRGWALRSTGRR